MYFEATLTLQDSPEAQANRLQGLYDELDSHCFGTLEHSVAGHDITLRGDMRRASDVQGGATEILMRVVGKALEGLHYDLSGIATSRRPVPVAS
ncbi:MAG TPA: hypothetical protein VLF67_01875 [Candidatus Saccharimonas sp.]|nr:hypothetical protein [Candidatus Saccharimonas sp.]